MPRLVHTALVPSLLVGPQASLAQSAPEPPAIGIPREALCALH
jgi:hypothetical protein